MRQIAILLLAAFAIGCNGNSNIKINNAPTAEIKADTPPASAEASKITVTLTGGANPGTYTASSTETTCSMGMTGEKSFGNQYSVDGKGAKEFSSLQLMVDDYDAAKAGTDKFLVTVSFGKILEGASYTINTTADKPKGSGKLSISESGSQKIVTVDGKTEDGVGIKATLTCGKTMAADGTVN